VVAATISKPDVVLKRPAGSNGRFAEHVDLPSDLGVSETGGRPNKSRRPEPKRRPAPEISEKDAKKAAADFEREQRRRDAERRREEAAREKDRERCEKATAKAQAALDKAEREHANKAADIRAEAEALEKRRGRPVGKGEGEAAGCAAARSGIGRQCPVNHRDSLRKNILVRLLKLVARFQIFSASPLVRSGCRQGPAT
jgi:hypothetical protein